MTDRVDWLPIAIVNEDGVSAQKALEDPEIRMIINIPQGFTGQISNLSGKAELRYLVNESNPQMVSNVMRKSSRTLQVTAYPQTSKS